MTLALVDQILDKRGKMIDQKSFDQIGLKQNQVSVTNKNVNVFIVC